MNKSSQNYKIAFLNPPYLEGFSRSQRSPGVIKSGTMYYPYWLAHALGVADKEGFNCHLLDAPAQKRSLGEVKNFYAEFKPNMIVIETSTSSSENDYKCAAELKEEFPATIIVMVGTHVTALWEDALAMNKQIDFVAIGEYDYVILDLAKAHEKFTNQFETENFYDFFKDIPALGYRAPSGSIRRGPLRSPIEDMDSLPWIAPVYKRFLNVKDYYFSLADYPMVMLIGGRGCVAKCTYCVYPQVMHGHSYRTRSAESVTGEMLWIQENMPEVREIVFEDDTFTGDKAFALDVARLVKEKNIKLKWFANVRANIDKEVLFHLKQAGLRCCAVGFESGDDLLLKNMWKGNTHKRQQEFVKDCHEVGILVHGCFMVGFPGETYETMNKTLEFAKLINPDSAQFYPVMPFPGTSYYKWALENKYLATENFSEWLTPEGGHRCVLNLPGLTPKQIENFCEKAYKKFYFRPKYMLYKALQSVASFREGVRSLKSFLFYIFYLLFQSKKRDSLSEFKVTPIMKSPDWYRLHRSPKGRMFLQEDFFRKNHELKQNPTEITLETKDL
jgi:anaerobic magnesium-protoporphyrin IX monomethyl ester cyclase